VSLWLVSAAEPASDLVQRQMVTSVMQSYSTRRHFLGCALVQAAGSQLVRMEQMRGTQRRTPAPAESSCNSYAIRVSRVSRGRAARSPQSNRSSVVAARRLQRVARSRRRIVQGLSARCSSRPCGVPQRRGRCRGLCAGEYARAKWRLSASPARIRHALAAGI
jgi:hypothetical protein